MPVAKIIEIDEVNKVVKLQLMRSKACGNCNACGVKTIVVEAFVENIEEYKVGDIVEVNQKYEDFLKITFLVFAIPSIVLVILILLIKSKMLLLTSTMMFFAFYFIFLKSFDKKIKGKTIIVKKR